MAQLHPTADIKTAGNCGKSYSTKSQSIIDTVFFLLTGLPLPHHIHKNPIHLNKSQFTLQTLFSWILFLLFIPQSPIKKYNKINLKTNLKANITHNTKQPLKQNKICHHPLFLLVSVPLQQPTTTVIHHHHHRLRHIPPTLTSPPIFTKPT